MVEFAELHELTGTDAVGRGKPLVPKGAARELVRRRVLVRDWRDRARPRRLLRPRPSLSPPRPRPAAGAMPEAPVYQAWKHKFDMASREIKQKLKLDREPTGALSQAAISRLALTASTSRSEASVSPEGFCGRHQRQTLRDNGVCARWMARGTGAASAGGGVG